MGNSLKKLCGERLTLGDAWAGARGSSKPTRVMFWGRHARLGLLNQHSSGATGFCESVSLLVAWRKRLKLGRELRKVKAVAWNKAVGFGSWRWFRPWKDTAKASEAWLSRHRGRTSPQVEIANIGYPSQPDVCRWRKSMCRTFSAPAQCMWT